MRSKADLVRFILELIIGAWMNTCNAEFSFLGSNGLHHQDTDEQRSALDMINWSFLIIDGMLVFVEGRRERINFFLNINHF